MWKLLLPLVVLVVTLTLAVTADDTGKRADFVYVENSDIATIDPHKATWLPDLRVVSCLFEGLVRNDPASAEFTPVAAAAESWTVSPDGLEWTFLLRANAKWSNGDPVTANDFVFSFRRGLLPDTACQSLSKFQLVRGGRDFTAFRQQALDAFRADSSLTGAAREQAAAEVWRATVKRFADSVGIKALDQRTLRITLERPTPYLLEVLAYEQLAPVHPATLAKFQSIDAQSGAVRWNVKWTRPEHAVTNGPFTLERWRFKRDLRLTRSKTYWNADNVALGTIDLLVIADPNAAVLAFNAGSADWITDATVSYRDELLARRAAAEEALGQNVKALRQRGEDELAVARVLPPGPASAIHAFPAFGTAFYNFNCRARLSDGRPNPFADPRVRRAFSLAIDRANIVRAITRCSERPARTLIPPGSIAGYTGPTAPPGAPDAAATDEARRLLADAGYPAGKGFITVEILFNKSAENDLIAQAVKKDWERTLGVSVLLVQKERNAFSADVRSGNYIVSRASWFGDFGDPVTFLDINRTGDGDNNRGYSNPGYDQLLALAAVTADPAARMKALAEAERIVTIDDPAVAPLYHYVNVELFDPHRVRGITAHPRQKQYPALFSIADSAARSEAAR